MRICPAQPEDLDAVCALVADAVRRMRDMGIDQWDEVYPARSHLEEDIQRGELYLAYRDDILTGIFVLNKRMDEAYHAARWQYPAQEACVLHRLCVAPAAQGRGTATVLMGEVRRIAREKGYGSMRLDVFTLNPAARRLYEKDGFLPVGFADWRKGRFILMERPL